MENEDFSGALRRMGNPYAKIGILGDSADSSPEAVHLYVRRLENPYAAIEEALETEAAPQEQVGTIIAAERSHTPQPSKISKRDFERSCRAVFRQYIPLSGGRETLPEYARGFIAKHANRPPEERVSVLTKLERYCLRDLDPLILHLNRERPESTRMKLDSIK